MDNGKNVTNGGRRGRYPWCSKCSPSRCVHRLSDSDPGLETGTASTLPQLTYLAYLHPTSAVEDLVSMHTNQISIEGCMMDDEVIRDFDRSNGGCWTRSSTPSDYISHWHEKHRTGTYLARDTEMYIMSHFQHKFTKHFIDGAYRRANTRTGIRLSNFA